MKSIHDHDIHQPDEECHYCIAKGYKSGLEAAIENVTTTINKRLANYNQAIDFYSELRDLILDNFGEEFFEVDDNGLADDMKVQHA